MSLRPIIFSGIGKMGGQALEHALLHSEQYEKQELRVLPMAIEEEAGNVEIAGQNIKLISHDDDFYNLGIDNPIVIDFAPSKIMSQQIEKWTKLNIDAIIGSTFASGTSDEEKQKVYDLTQKASSLTTLSPNFALPVAKLQAVFHDYISTLDDDSLAKVHFKGTDSHQEAKKSFSGTMNAICDDLRSAGLREENMQMCMIRDPTVQRKLGVPEEYLGGHGWHFYRFTPDNPEHINIEIMSDNILRFLSNSELFQEYFLNELSDNSVNIVSPEKDVTLEANHERRTGIYNLSHRINGRKVYCEGIPLVAGYVNRQSQEGKTGMRTNIDAINDYCSE
ncbi:MAG: hypothetical protein ACOCP4_05985 [Candidatus Woesearchaeota archaeon]